MKKITIFSLMIFLLAITGACREEFLQTEPTETVSSPSAEFKLNGLYLLMVETGTGGTTGHDDFGQKGYDIYTDLLSSDMVLGGTTYGWYSNIANYSAPVDFTTNPNYIPWRYYYRLVNAANDVIEGLGGNDAQLSGTKGYSMGQAKAIRAYAYYNLLQLYTPKYDPAALSIPIYKELTAQSAPRAPQSEVYDFMIDDLTKSIALLDGFTRKNKGIINKNVAKGILAYVYAAKGDYPKVVQVAGDLVSTSGFPLTTRAQATGGFNRLETGSWMWGFDITLDNDLDLISWWGQVDIYTYSYAWAGDPKAIDENLYNSIRTDDVRKTQFAGSYEGVNLLPTNKFYHPGRVIGGQRVIETDYIYMRIDEFHMLYAEALAKTGQTSLAKTVYKNFLANRLTDTSYIDGLSDAQLITDIYTNTRIEFWGEGKTYSALKRNKATITRGANHLSYDGQSFGYDDNRLYLKIPQAEVIANPNL